MLGLLSLFLKRRFHSFIHWFFYFCLGYTQLYSGFTFGSALWDLSWQALVAYVVPFLDQFSIRYMVCKHPTCCTISLVIQIFFTQTIIWCVLKLSAPTILQHCSSKNSVIMFCKTFTKFEREKVWFLSLDDVSWEDICLSCD